MPPTVRVLSFEATLFGDRPDGSVSKDAFINVYITSDLAEAAHDIARREIARAGWSILKATGERVVTEKSYDQSPDGLQYYKQCLQDGVVIVIHTWQHSDQAH